MLVKSMSQKQTHPLRRLLHNPSCCFCTILKTEPTHGKMFLKSYNPFLFIPTYRHYKVLQIQNILGFGTESAASWWLTDWFWPHVALVVDQCWWLDHWYSFSRLWPSWAVEHSSYGRDVSLASSLLHDGGDIQKHALKKTRRQLWLNCT